MRIQAILLMLLGLLAICQAQLKITLDFGKAGQREVFASSELPNDPPTNTVKAAGATLEYNLPAFGGNDRIYVWDRTTNNIASKPIKDIANGKWSVKEYTAIGLFRVRLEHKGDPVQAAKIMVSSKGKSQERLLDPAGKGEVQFFGYPAGDLRVKATYNTADKKQASQQLVFTESLARDKAEPVLTIAVPEDVSTSQDNAPSVIASGPSTSSKQQKDNVDQGSPTGKLVIMALALAAIAAVGYWVFHMAKHKPREFEDTLQKLGVQVPKPQDPNGGAPLSVAPLPPAPPAPKIMLDDAEPVPLAGATTFTPPVGVASEPALVRESGGRVTIAEGETLVGREDGLSMTLSGESSVSRRHAKITRVGAEVTVTDMGSTNGTFVNGNRLQGDTVLKSGDQVQFGSVRFRYEG